MMDQNERTVADRWNRNADDWARALQDGTDIINQAVNVTGLRVNAKSHNPFNFLNALEARHPFPSSWGQTDIGIRFARLF